MPDPAFALQPAEFIRSIRATRDTLAKPEVNLGDVVARVRTLTDDAPYAVVGGHAMRTPGSTNKSPR